MSGLQFGVQADDDADSDCDEPPVVSQDNGSDVLGTDDETEEETSDDSARSAMDSLSDADVLFFTFCMEHDMSAATCNDLLKMVMSISNIGDYVKLRSLSAFHKVLDGEAAADPMRWRTEPVVIDGESYDFLHRPVLNTAQSLVERQDYAHWWQDRPVLGPASRPSYSEHINADPCCQLQHEIDLRFGDTKVNLLSLMLSSDETTITQFNTRSLHPIYVTIENYKQAARQHEKARLIPTRAIAICLAPAATFGDLCLKHDMRSLAQIQELARLAERPSHLPERLNEAGYNPWPWQENAFHSLPSLSIFAVVTMDILHQVRTGLLMTYLIQLWIPAFFHRRHGTHASKLFALYQSGFGMMRDFCEEPMERFPSGIAALTNVTGNTVRSLVKQLLLALIGLTAEADAEPVPAVQCMLDMYYVAIMPVHTAASLSALTRLIDELSSTHHSLFATLANNNDLTVRMPKWHMLAHYPDIQNTRSVCIVRRQKKVARQTSMQKSSMTVQLERRHNHLQVIHHLAQQRVAVPDQPSEQRLDHDYKIALKLGPWPAIAGTNTAGVGDQPPQPRINPSLSVKHGDGHVTQSNLLGGKPLSLDPDCPLFHLLGRYLDERFHGGVHARNPRQQWPGPQGWQVHALTSVRVAHSIGTASDAYEIHSVHCSPVWHGDESGRHDTVLRLTKLQSSDLERVDVMDDPACIDHAVFRPTRSMTSLDYVHKIIEVNNISRRCHLLPLWRTGVNEGTRITRDSGHPENREYLLNRYSGLSMHRFLYSAQ
ncbi:hypothetical protein RI367_002913 [Sorochytrium milnesiophthora]